jgi:DNA polymerase III epsilon subunit-like protein
MRNASSRLVFFDIETGGLNPKKHPILQLAAIAVDDHHKPVGAFDAKVRFDEREANRTSLRKNHYRRGLWAREADEPVEVAKNFAAFLRHHASVPMLASDGSCYHVAQLAAHNASFDGAFLRSWYDRHRTFLPAHYRVLCTLQRAMWYFQEHHGEPGPKDFKLATLCQYFGIDFHAASAHEALADVSATVALCQAIQRRSLDSDLLMPVRNHMAAGQILLPSVEGSA